MAQCQFVHGTNAIKRKSPDLEADNDDGIAIPINAIYDAGTLDEAGLQGTLICSNEEAENVPYPNSADFQAFLEQNLQASEVSPIRSMNLVPGQSGQEEGYQQSLKSHHEYQVPLPVTGFIPHHHQQQEQQQQEVDGTHRRVVGRPHIATINVLKASNPGTSRNDQLEGTGMQQVPYPHHSTPSATSKRVMSASSSLPSVFGARKSLDKVRNTELNYDSPAVLGRTSDYTSSFSSSTDSHHESSPDYHDMSSYFHPTPEGFSDGNCRQDMPVSGPQIEDPILLQYYIPYMNERENHNIKERQRRNRVATACNAVRSMIPGLSEKTDKATVFERAVEYLNFLKSQVGDTFDRDFLEYLNTLRSSSQ